jgi:hypothetical protein
MRCIVTLFLACLMYTLSHAQQKHPFLDNTTYTRSLGVTPNLPWCNMYSHYNYETGRSNTKAGFVGLGLSFYYKQNKSKYSLNTGFTGDLPAPIGPISFGKTGTRYAISSAFVETNFHHAIYKGLWGIAGVNYVNYRYYFIDYDNDREFTRHDPTMGLTAGLEYVTKWNIGLAIIYRPALVAFRTKQYWHLLSVDLRMDLPVWRK